MARTTEARFAAWCRLGGTPLICLAEELSTVVVPIFLENGFARVSVYMRDPSDRISAREIRLERLSKEHIEGLTISFDKYHRPSFQVSADRRWAVGAKDWVRAANIVKRPRQYICFWGSPWWLPLRLWSTARSRKVAERLRLISPEILAFLNDGHLSRHIRVTTDTMAR